MKALGYYNGEFGPLDDMRIPMTDRAVYFGDGVYEATLSRNGAIYALDQHVDRMFRSAEMVKITPPVDKETMKAELYRMVREMDDAVMVVYWQLSRGTGHRDHPFPQGPANFMMMIKPHELHDITAPVSCVTREDTRFLHCNIKTINLIPSVMAMQYARDNGCYEAILHRGDRVTECSRSNVHILKDGKLITAPADNLILAGIARAHIIEKCGELGVPVEEKPYTLDALMNADEIMTSSSSSFLRRVDHIDQKPVGGKDRKTVDAIQSAVWNRFLAATDAK